MTLQNERYLDSSLPADIDIAQGIWEQLGGQDFLRTTGATQGFTIVRGLRMRLPGHDFQGINFVKITLNHDNLYNVEFGRHYIKQDKTVYHRISSALNIHANNLRKTFTEHTGLRAGQ